MLRDHAFGKKTAELAPGTSRDSLNNTSLNRYRDYMSRFNPNANSRLSHIYLKNEKIITIVNNIVTLDSQLLCYSIF